MVLPMGVVPGVTENNALAQPGLFAQPVVAAQAV
jgi:hypothetical protein